MSDTTEKETVVTPENEPEKKEAEKQDPGKSGSEDLEALKATVKSLKAELTKASGSLENYKKKEQEEIEKQKTSEQKLAESQQELSRLKRENLVVKIASKKGLDADLFDRVRGESEQDIEADIDLLLAKLKPAVQEDAAKAAGKKTQPAKTNNLTVLNVKAATDSDFEAFLKGESA